MGKKDKEKIRAERQKQWEKENLGLQSLWKQGLKLKQLARSRGYGFRYFDLLDSNEAVFNELVEDCRNQHPSLLNVAEVSWEEFNNVEDGKYGIEPALQRVIFRDNNSTASTYNDPDQNANLNGMTLAYQEMNNPVRTLVLIPQSVRCPFQHRDHKYHFKLIALLHELGHVDDMEKQVNFNMISRHANIISAEVYANCYALDKANQLGLFAVATTLIDSLKHYVNGSDYRAEVARRVNQEYRPPSVQTWQKLTGWNSTSDDTI